MSVHPSQDMGEVCDRVHAIGLAGRDKGVQTSEVLSCGVVADKENNLSVMQSTP
jgi:hypothetical protein